MRVTCCVPGRADLDLELTAGVPVGALRPHLARVTGCPDAARAPLAIGAVLLDDAHLSGTFPLVSGARITVGTTLPTDDDVFAAARAPRHVAVVAGPDAGTVRALGPGLEVGRAGDDHDAGRLALRDAQVSGRHLEVRSPGVRVWLRDLGSANGSRRSRRWLGHRVEGAVPRWWSRWRLGDRVRVGASVLELRTTVRPSVPDSDDQAAATGTGPPRPRRDKLLVVATAIAPAVGSLALVTGTGNPALLAVGLAGPALLPVLLRGRSRTRVEPPADSIGACDLAIDLARAVLTRTAAPPPAVLDRLAPTGSLAVVGPAARAVAATLVLAAQPGRVEVRGANAHAWGWTRWLGTGAGRTPPGPDVVVVDGGTPPGDAGGRTIVLVDPSPVPSWCGARLDAGTGRWSGPDGERDWTIWPGGPRWAEAQARLVAGARCVEQLGSGGLPDAITLGELGLPDDAAKVTAAWAAAGDDLAAVLGAGPGGKDVVVDLVREGPHVLVAGTTGSGKSELLRALVASLALRYPPTALAFALVDFKGGAGFGALSGLPHVVGTVTDLDAHDAARALAGLAAELRARKELLARVGATDLRDWPPAASEPHPGRLVVVVDEFRALAEELPDLMGALVRVATQGRSLGVHLVLATQRPSGVVSAELRANVALRLALRVTDAADSADVLDVPDAAEISPRQPGRALLRRGPGPVEELQVALLGGGQPPVRLADDRVDAACASGGAVVAGPARATSPEPDEVLVAAVAAAAARWRADAPRPAAPWLPALPSRVGLEDLTAAEHVAPELAGRGDRLPFGLADVPDAQSRALASWDPGTGHLLAVGGPASGRTTLLTTLAGAALARGWSVHAVGLPELARGPAPAGLGTVCGPDDPRRLARLVTLLLEAPPRTLLLVDGIERVAASLEDVARGEGAVRLLELVQERAVALAATTAVTSGPWLTHAAHRVVLPLADDAAESLAGVPRELCGARRGPGRAVSLPPRAEPLVCQVALPGPLGRSAHRPDTDHRASTNHRTDPQPGPRPVRLQPLPLTAVRPAVATSRRARLALGLGGDAARPVGLDPETGGLVVGPAGSGRSTALAHLVRSAVETGLDPLLVARDGPVREAVRALGDPAGSGDGRLFGFDREPLLAALSAAPRPDLVVVDDLDALARLAPEVTDLIDRAVESGTVLLASLTTMAALSSYQGAVTTLRAARHGVVLGAHTPGSDEVFDSPLAWHVDPARPAHPGRGVLQRGSDLVAVQVFAPHG